MSKWNKSNSLSHYSIPLANEEVPGVFTRPSGVIQKTATPSLPGQYSRYITYNAWTWLYKYPTFPSRYRITGLRRLRFRRP
jgi:hypothetical protein